MFGTGQPRRDVGYRLFTNNGRLRHFEISVSLVQDAQGQPCGFRGTVRDITERRVADEAARLQSAYLAALQNTTVGLMQRLEITELLEDILQRAGSLVNSQNGCLYLLVSNENKRQMRVGTSCRPITSATASNPATVWRDASGRAVSHSWSTINRPVPGPAAGPRADAVARGSGRAFVFRRRERRRDLALLCGRSPRISRQLVSLVQPVCAADIHRARQCAALRAKTAPRS